MLLEIAHSGLVLMPFSKRTVKIGGRYRNNLKETRRKTGIPNKKRQKLSLFPVENLHWLPQHEKRKLFKGFFFINATITECPDLSDKSPLSPLPSHYRFPTESKWENSILCFSTLWSYKPRFWSLDACVDSGTLCFLLPELRHALDPTWWTQ